jgi:peptide subunit release factor 1 (eRF1)
LLDFRKNCNSSKFAQYLNEGVHTFGALENIMQNLKNQKKGPHLNNMELFYSQKEATSENELNDKQNIFPTKTFGVILNIRT